MADTPPFLRQILVPALVTILITALRFCGELLDLAPPLFSREAGGGGALVGIGWLIPVFGAIFAMRLLHAGMGPVRPVSAVAMLLLGCGLVAVAFAIAKLLIGPTPWAMAVGACGSVLGGLCAFHAWRKLGRLLLAYAVAARVPVMGLAFADVLLGLGTHYGKLAPGAPEYAALPRALLLCVAQIVFWVPLTLLFGGIAGLCALAIGGRRARRRRDAVSTAERVA